MTEETRKKIIDWILENHEHHYAAEKWVSQINDDGSNTPFAKQNGESECNDGNYPYVNSMELEKFIKSL